MLAETLVYVLALLSDRRGYQLWLWNRIDAAPRGVNEVRLWAAQASALGLYRVDGNELLRIIVRGE